MERPNFICNHAGLKEGAHIIHHSLCNGDDVEDKLKIVVLPTNNSQSTRSIETEDIIKPRDPIGTGT